MGLKSTDKRYGTGAVVLHWASAVLILAMIPLGFLMQSASEGTKLFLYRAHAAVGVAVLLLTVARVLWRFVDTTPVPTPGLMGLHLRGMKTIHFLLYALMLARVGKAPKRRPLGNTASFGNAAGP